MPFSPFAIMPPFRFHFAFAISPLITPFHWSRFDCWCHFIIDIIAIFRYFLFIIFIDFHYFILLMPRHFTPWWFSFSPLSSLLRP
jgi:hypothetical protein